MDTALILKKKTDSGEIASYSQASVLLHKSEIVKALLVDFEINTLNLLNKLTELSEIPLASQLERVQTCVNFIRCYNKE